MTNEQETNMIAAHQAGIAYWRNNRPADRANVEQVARSCGWGESELLASWMAGYFCERARTKKLASGDKSGINCATKA
jgi:hypothetical protein